jgi:FMN phosphatase YigB (HAD superfamily)
MNKFIALDIGGVCIKLRHGQCLEYLGFSDDLSQVPGELLAAIDRLERGTIPESEWLEVFQKNTGNRFSDEQLCYAWNLIIGEDMDGMPELIREITELGYSFIFFSDTSRLHIMDAYRKISFVHLISGHIYSYDVGAKKPEQGMYEAFEKTYGKPCFYLDDKPENIAGGERHGWTSHLFTSAEGFRKQFFEMIQA